MKLLSSISKRKTKVKLFEDVNEGRVRILIGSTEKMGAGTNIQKKLCALHHIDVPWRPSDVGRILRKKKKKKNVEVTDNGKIIIRRTGPQIRKARRRCDTVLNCTRRRRTGNRHLGATALRLSKTVP